MSLLSVLLKAFIYVAVVVLLCAVCGGVALGILLLASSGTSVSDFVSAHTGFVGRVMAGVVIIAVVTALFILGKVFEQRAATKEND